MFKKKMISLVAFTLLSLLLLQTVGVGMTAAAGDVEEEVVNAALKKPVIASSTHNVSSDGWTTEALTDGSYARGGWHDLLHNDITEQSPVNLLVDLQGKYRVDSIKLFNSGTYPWSAIPRGYEIQISLDAQTWTTVASETAANCVSGGLTYELAGLEACYVRVRITDDSEKYDHLTAIGELEVWGVLLESQIHEDPIYDWPDPTFQEKETVSDDTVNGTLTYVPSADGSTVTISYEENGEIKSYTVPNQSNYLFGGYAGVDDLNRALYNSDSEGVGAVSAEQERYVGLFYFLWHGAHDAAGTNGTARNLQAILDGTSTVGYGINGEMHWFAEPLYGYYFANDNWVLRKHAELLTNAGVDFLYFDVTNLQTYSSTALQMMSILHELNEQGYDAPQVVFYTNTGALERIQQLYNSIYRVNKYPDTWFCIDGKPVIVAPNITDQTLSDTTKITDFFTVKSAQWPVDVEGVEINNNFELNNNSWPWIDFHWPQRIYTDANGGEAAISVSVAQHAGNANFSSSTLAGYSFNRGRSFASSGTKTDYPYYDEEFNQYQNPLYGRALRTAYRNAMEDPTLSYRGTNFQEQFDYAIASNAKYILVTGWNEWVAGNTGDEEEPGFVDTASIEYSRDTEMMRGGYFDNYYMQLIQNIQRVKGTAPVIVQDARKPINVTGDFDQWDDVPVTYSDPSGDTEDRNHRGYGADGYTIYTNTSGRNDIVSTKVIGDTKNLYFYIQTVDPITQYDADSSWMQIYLNTDCDASTGWYGYDYIVNYKAKGDFETTVAKYTGTDGGYGFTEVTGTVSYRVKGNQMMVEVPQEILGIENYLGIALEFKVADSRTLYDEMEDFYCDGDVAPLGRLNYVYRGGSISNGEQETDPSLESDTSPDTSDVNEGTDPDSTVSGDESYDTESDPTGETDRGCSSALAISTACVLLLSTAVLLVRRKHE